MCRLVFGATGTASLLQPALEMWISECSADIGETIVSCFVRSWEDGALSRLNHSATQPFFFSPLFPKVKEESGRHAERNVLIKCSKRYPLSTL